MAKRTANFTVEEEQLLVQLVEKHKNIIECKKSGATSWQEKEKAWKKIEEEFNSNNKRNYFRSLKNFKEKYLNLKKKTKAKFSTNNKNLTGTGGGPTNAVTFSDVDLSIKNIIGKQVDGLQNPYDSDACENILSSHEISEPTTNEKQIDEEDMLEEDNEIIIEVFDDTDKENVTPNSFVEKTKNIDWSDYTSKHLKTPTSSKLKNTNCYKKTNSTSFPKKYPGIQYKLMDEKLKFVQLQQEKFLVEHALRISLLKKKIEIAEIKCRRFA